jgi:hypothetical protein
MGQFILSGSQNFHLIHNITQSLSGRIALCTLFPLDFYELRKSKLLKSNLSDAMTTGNYPAIYDRDIDPRRYYKDYIDTYIKRDITQIQQIQDMNLFNRFIKLCAGRAGQILNYNDLAKDAGISHTTARNWLSLLEASYIVYTLPPYYKNFNKRMIKSPKLYFYDSGLLCSLLNINPKTFDPRHAMWGSIFENMVITECIKQNAHRSLFRDYYYWRDSHGNEVDLLTEQDGKILLYEVKASTTIKSEMFKGLDYLANLIKDDAVVKTLIYGGNQDEKRTNYNIVGWCNL